MSKRFQMLIPRFKTGVFPFVDLCPWLKAEDKDLTVAVGFLREYMSIMKPLSFDFCRRNPSLWQSRILSMRLDTSLMTGFGLK